MIELKDITTKYFSNISFKINEGAVCKLIARSDKEKDLLLNIILGLKRPFGGNVFLFGSDIYSISEKECIKLFRRTGTVLKDGGMISNLKVWENIVLPTWYHQARLPAGLEDRILGITGEMGFTQAYLKDSLVKLPGHLQIQEKRLFGLLRAMLTGPELMIYDSIFEGLDNRTAGILAEITGRFQAASPGRASVYISSDALSMEHVQADRVISIAEA